MSAHKIGSKRFRLTWYWGWPLLAVSFYDSSTTYSVLWVDIAVFH